MKDAAQDVAEDVSGAAEYGSVKVFIVARVIFHRPPRLPWATREGRERHLYHFGLPTVLTEWAHLAQDRAGWHKLVTTPPFAIGKPFVRQPRGDTRVTPEDKRRAVAQRAAEIAERRAVFDANSNN